MVYSFSTFIIQYSLRSKLLVVDLGFWTTVMKGQGRECELGVITLAYRDTTPPDKWTEF